MINAHIVAITAQLHAQLYRNPPAADYVEPAQPLCSASATATNDQARAVLLLNAYAGGGLLDQNPNKPVTPGTAGSVLLDTRLMCFQARASRWAAVGIASLRDEHLDNLPEELWSIGPSIRVADFGSNKLTCISSSLSVFSALQRLRLSHNQLPDEGIPWTALAAMPQLAVLALDHNRFALLLQPAKLPS